MIPHRLVTAFLTLAAATPAHAYEPSAESRTVSIEHAKAAMADASPVEPRTLEVELAYVPLWNGRLFRASGAAAHVWTLTATYGLAQDVDANLSGAFGVAHDPAGTGTARWSSGLGDLVAGARWRFLSLPEQALELAATVETVIPTGSSSSSGGLSISQGFWSGRLGIVGTKDMGRLTFNAELALTTPIAGAAAGLVALGELNVAAGYQVTSWLQPEIELNQAYTSAAGTDSYVLAITAGVVAPLGSGHRIMAAVQQSIATWNAVPTSGAVVAYKIAL